MILDKLISLFFTMYPLNYVVYENHRFVNLLLNNYRGFVYKSVFILNNGYYLFLCYTHFLDVQQWQNYKLFLDGRGGNT